MKRRDASDNMERNAVRRGSETKKLQAAEGSERREAARGANQAARLAGTT